MRTSTVIRTLVLAISVALLWIAPPVGFVAVAILFVILPPWGKTLSERAVISALVLLGMTAIVFPRASDLLPVDHLSARVFFAAVLVGSYALRLIPQLRSASYPRPKVLDAVLGLFLAFAAWIPIHEFRGAGTEATLSSLFHNGWDNHGHFTMFANTFTQQSTLWQTADGSIAWNQWYPSLHATFWSLTQFALSDATPGRLALIEPFAIWSAATFAVSLAALAWVSADLAGRLAKHFGLPQYTAIIAALGFMIFGLLGSVQFLLSAGFTNFFIAVSVAIVASYISARSRQSARTLGWFLLPLAGVAVIGLWTPLVIALIPAGVVTVAALWRFKKPLAIAWLVIGAVAGGYLVIAQSQAVISASDSNSALDFNSEIGAVGIGMVPFNLALALNAPLIALLLSVVVWRAFPAYKSFIAGALMPTVFVGLLAVFFMSGADASSQSRLASYYVLKALDAGMVMLIPALSAAAALILLALLVRTSRALRVIGLIAAGALAVSSFGYVGGNADRLAIGFSAAPGIEANNSRVQWITDDLMGKILADSAIVHEGELAKTPNGYSTPVLWDGSGQLQNLWVNSLTGVLTLKQTDFYSELPDFPYDQVTLDAIGFSLQVDSNEQINILWLRPVSGELIVPWVQANQTGRVTQAQVPHFKSAVCEECVG